MHRSSMLVYHNSLERHSSVIIYDRATVHVSVRITCFVLYFKDIMQLMLSKRKDRKHPFTVYTLWHQYWLFHGIKVWRFENFLLLNISVWLKLLYPTWNDHIAYCFVLHDLLGLFIIWGAFLTNVTFILTLLQKMLK